MLLKNVKIENSPEASNIKIENGYICDISANAQAATGETVIDCRGSLVIPPFVDSHVHLDTCLSLDKTGPNVSGTLFEGIQLWSKYRKTLCKKEIQERARRTLQLYKSHGVQFIRSHIDISHDLTAMDTLLELKAQVADEMEIQLVAFPQDGVFYSAQIRENLEEALKMGADVVGGIPHFEFTHEYGNKSIAYIMELAQKYDKLVDIHCDEIDDEQSRFVEVLAASAFEAGIGQRVTASHTTAMHSYNGAYCSKLYRLLKISGIHIVANPLVNVNLQGRFDDYPKRRGITRVKELLENGVNVSFGHDDICDPFYPLGNGDMMSVLSMGLHLCHMMGYEELMNSYMLATCNGAKTLNIEPDQYGIGIGKPASFLVLDAANFLEALQYKKDVLYSFRHGNVIGGTLLENVVPRA